MYSKIIQLYIYMPQFFFMRRKWEPTLVFLGKSHRQRSLAGYSPGVLKESDTTE